MEALGMLGLECTYAKQGSDGMCLQTTEALCHSLCEKKRKENKGKEGQGREGKGREGKGREGRGREGKRREGKEWKGKERKGKERKSLCFLAIITGAS